MTNEPIQAETSDLQQIRGIGPGLARRLGGAGLGDVARLAVASPQDVSAVRADSRNALNFMCFSPGDPFAVSQILPGGQPN